VSPRRFDSVLVSIDIGASRTIRRLNVGERWTFIAGVLALAAKSPIRGALLNGLIVVNWNDYQREPKASDSRAAWKARKQKQRDKDDESRADVTRDSHAGRVAQVTPLSRGEEKRREGKG
jgi:hypothetical protein